MTSEMKLAGICPNGTIRKYTIITDGNTTSVVHNRYAMYLPTRRARDARAA
jgi:hypothetical protein